VSRSRKSIKHRQLSAAHRAAKEAGKLDEFYAQRDAERLAAERGVRTQPPPPAAAPPPRRDAPTPPANPFDAAYSGRPITPEGASWPTDETGYSRYMVWRLPISTSR
jgi:hypothetical protein